MVRPMDAAVGNHCAPAARLAPLKIPRPAVRAERSRIEDGLSAAAAVLKIELAAPPALEKGAIVRIGHGLRVAWGCLGHFAPSRITLLADRPWPYPTMP